MTLAEIDALILEYGSLRKAATAIGINESTLRAKRLRAVLQSERGENGTLPVMPGFAIARTSAQFGPRGEVQKEWVTQKPAATELFEAPADHAIKGVSALVDANGRTIQQWIRTREGAVNPAAVMAEMQAHFSKFKPAAKPRKAPDLSYADQLTLYPWADPHFGLTVWGKEASENWDLKISVQTIRETFADTVARTAPTKHAILLVGGDTTHADNNLNRTPQSGHALQVDGRHQKVMLTAGETMVANTDALLTRHETVDLIVIPGNHDENTAYALVMFLYAWYRDEPRVTVDISPSLFRFREFGQVMLGTTHGHTVKQRDMPQIMAARQAEMWGRTRFRYVHTFHVHHSSKLLSEGGGCIAETHQIIAPQDAWHFNAGYLSGRSMQSICYHRERGEVSRVRVAVG